ncbi:unnamed protein product [Phaeothamnion confervicola]
MDHLFLVPNHNLKRLIKDLITEGGEGLYVREEGEEYGRYRFALVTEQVLILRCLGPLESDWNGKSFRVTQRGCIGGRKQPAQLGGSDFMHFSDATVSRRHLEISFNEEERQFYLRDFGSAGGTFVRVPFGVPKPLAPGMMVMLGKHQVRSAMLLFFSLKAPVYELSRFCICSRHAFENYRRLLIQQLLVSSCEDDGHAADSSTGVGAPVEAASKEGSPMGPRGGGLGGGRVSKRLIEELSNLSIAGGGGAGDERTVRGHVGRSGTGGSGRGSVVDADTDAVAALGGFGSGGGAGSADDGGDKLLVDGEGAEDAASVSDMPFSGAEDKRSAQQAGGAHPGGGGGGSSGSGGSGGNGASDDEETTEAAAKSLAEAFRAEAKLARGHRQLSLRCFAPEGTPIQDREFVVGPEGATLGRKQTNTVPFSHDVNGAVMGIDSSISGEHARIEYDADNDCLQIWDGTSAKPSTNGTWFRLSGMHRESEPYALQDGAEILVGTVRFAASVESMIVEKEIAEGEDVAPYLGGAAAAADVSAVAAAAIIGGRRSRGAK